MVNEKAKQIYIFKNLDYDLLKIGMSETPFKRLNTISAAIGCDLALIYESDPIFEPRLIEQLIHAKLGKYRKKGEWFKVDELTALECVEECLREAKKAEYKDLTEKHQLTEPCITTFDYNLLKHSFTSTYKEVEPFIYDNGYDTYYIAYRQGKLFRTSKFCSLRVAKQFKKENIDILISAE